MGEIRVGGESQEKDGRQAAQPCGACAEAVRNGEVGCAQRSN
jgi:hypothetical protein